MSLVLKVWMDTATKEQINKLAMHAATSVGYLYQIASGRRFASADTAARIELAAELMSQFEATPGLLPRDFLARACLTCPYALRCGARKPNPKPETKEGNTK